MLQNKHYSKCNVQRPQGGKYALSKTKNIFCSEKLNYDESNFK